MQLLRNRQSNRLKGYDYARNGLYFITIVCQDRDERFGEIVDGEMVLNDAGKMVESVWLDVPKWYGVEIYSHIVMPNHFHGIIAINHDVVLYCERATTGGSPLRSPLTCRGGAPVPARDDCTNRMSLSDIVHRFKSLTTHRYSNGVKMGLVPPFSKRLWQRNYHDHIIRNEKEYTIIDQYIRNNPQCWEDDLLRKREGMMEESAVYCGDWRNWL